MSFRKMELLAFEEEEKNIAPILIDDDDDNDGDDDDIYEITDLFCEEYDEED